MAFKMADAYVEVTVRGPSEGQMRDARGRFTKGLDPDGKTSRSAGGSFAERFMAGFDEKASKANRSKALSALFKGALGASVLPPVLGAAAAGVVSLTSALGSAVPAAGAAGGALLAFKQGTLVAQVGLQGFSKGITGTSEDLDKLEPSARAAAVQLRSLIGPLKEGIQQKLFEGTGQAIHDLGSAYLPTLNLAGQQTAGVLNGIALKAAKMAEQPVFKKDLQTILAGNAQSLKFLGNAGLAGVDMFKDLAVAVQPVTLRFAKFVDLEARTASGFLAAKKNSGDLTDFFNKAGDNAAELGGALKDVSVGLYNIFASGKSPDAKNLLDTIDHGAAKFRDWTESAAGKNSIAKFFDDGRAAGDKLQGLLGSVGSAWSKFSDSKNFAAIVDIGKDLVDIAGKVGSSLSGFLAVMKPIADTVAWIITNVPGAAGAVSGLLAVLGGYKALKMVGVVGGIKSALNGIGSAASGSTGKVAGLKGTLGDLGGVTGKLGGLIGTVGLLTVAFDGTYQAAKALLGPDGPIGGIDYQPLTDMKNEAGLAGQVMSGTAKNAVVLEDAIGGLSTKAVSGGESIPGVIGQVDKLTGAYTTNKQALYAVHAAGQLYLDQVNKFGPHSAEAISAFQAWQAAAKSAQGGTDSLSGSVKNVTADIKGVPGQKKTKLIGDLNDLQDKIVNGKKNIASVPADKRTKFLADIHDAEIKAQQLKDKIDGLKGKTITVGVHTYVYTPTGPGAGSHTFGAVQEARGGIVHAYAGGAIAGMTSMSSRIADIVPPNSLRVIGDRVRGDEFFLPDDSSPRSLAIGSEWMRRRGLTAYKTGSATAAGPLPARVGAAPSPGAHTSVTIQQVVVQVDSKDFDSAAKVVKVFEDLPRALHAMGGPLSVTSHAAIHR